MGVDEALKTIFQRDDWDRINLFAIIEIILSIIRLLLLLGNVMAVVYIILNSFNYFTAFGSEEKTKKAKQGITYAAIGVVIITLAYFIVGFVLGFLVDPEYIPEETPPVY